MNHKDNHGFSLVELLVVIAAIGLLTSIAVVALGGARQKARNVKRLADVRQIMMSLEMYNTDTSGYPDPGDAVVLGRGEYQALCQGGFKDECDADDTVFQGQIPTAPTPVDGDCTEGENDYTYEIDASGEYVITFCLGRETGDFTAGVHTATPSGLR